MPAGRGESPAFRRVNRRRTAAALLAVVLSACAGPQEHVFRCSDSAVLRARYVADTVLLHLPEGSASLPIARSASGARYANDTLEFWEHAGAARITRRGATLYEECRPVR